MSDTLEEHRKEMSSLDGIIERNREEQQRIDEQWRLNDAIVDAKMLLKLAESSVKVCTMIFASLFAMLVLAFVSALMQLTEGSTLSAVVVFVIAFAALMTVYRGVVLVNEISDRNRKARKLDDLEMRRALRS